MGGAVRGGLDLRFEDLERFADQRIVFEFLQGIPAHFGLSRRQFHLFNDKPFAFEKPDLKLVPNELADDGLKQLPIVGLIAVLQRE
jgi:hypothetical protein